MRSRLPSGPSSQCLSVIALAALLPLAYGCSGSPLDLFDDDDDKACSEASALEVLEPEPGGIHGFASEQELDVYIAAIEARQPKATGGTGGSPCGKANGDAPSDNFSDGASAGAAPEADEGKSNEEITNNQEAGVDEGGIVKNVGSHLVVLRKGRLFVVDVGEGHASGLTDSIRVARTPALNHSVWYDEMLVKGDLVYVVGYRYGIPTNGGTKGVRGATEIDTFRLQDGKLTRLKSMFLESNDYYSGHNYASRMVDGKLLFYMPHYIGWQSGKLEYPRVLEANDAGTFTTVGPIFGALDVKTSLYKPLYPTFHTVVQCDLPDSGELSCHGRSVIGSWWRETYVSPTAVYLWASSHVYRFDFASLGVTAHGADGYPLDQFSFKESDKSFLVAVNGMDSSRYTGARVLSLPLSAFDTAGGQTAQSTSLGASVLVKNRFVGDVLVAALAAPPSWNDPELVSFDAATGIVARAPAGGPVVRIEPLGDRRALVVRGDRPYGATSLVLAAVPVDAPGTSVGNVVLEGVRQGEGRSHGFFYKPSGDGAGTFGYAVIAPPEYGAPNGYGNGISNLGFFDVTPSGAIGKLGIVSSGEDASQCETSCMDWYGNTRPIFLGRRVFALMGSEVVEVGLRPGAEKKGTPVALTFQE